MTGLLKIASNIKQTPNGEPITATQRLCLILILLDGGGEPVQLVPDKLCIRLGGLHTKSLPRLLKIMQDNGLLTVIPGRKKGGHRDAPFVYPLPKTRREQGNIQVTLQDPSNMEVTLQRPPSNIEVTLPEPSNIHVTKLNGNGFNNLPPPSNMEVTLPRGMEFVSKSLSLNTNSLLGGESSNLESSTRAIIEHPAVVLWGEIMAIPVALDGARRIASKVRYLDLWRDTLETWKASRWAPTNVGGQVEKYLKDEKSYTPPVKPQEKDAAKEQELRDLIYGDQ